MKSATVIVSLIILLLLPVGQGVSAATNTASIAQVWAREEEYGRSADAGNFEDYIKLWHEDFIGWPCGQNHPVRKSSVGKWVKEIRDKKIEVESTMTREGAQDFGDIVVVHYRSTEVDTYPDGHVEGRGEEFKITHTWMRVGDTWLIIGGMCANLGDAAK